MKFYLSYIALCIGALSLSVAPLTAYAANVFQPACADYTLGTGTCSGSNAVFIGASNHYWAGNSTSNLSWITAGMTVYFSVNVTALGGSSPGTARIYVYDQAGHIVAMPPCDGTTCAVGTYTDVAVVIPAGWVSSTSDVVGGDNGSISTISYNSLCVASAAGLNCTAPAAGGKFVPWQFFDY